MSIFMSTASTQGGRARTPLDGRLPQPPRVPVDGEPLSVSRCAGASSSTTGRTLLVDARARWRCDMPDGIDYAEDADHPRTHMTLRLIAQDPPSSTTREDPDAQVKVPWSRMEDGPRGARLHVVDYEHGDRSLYRHAPLGAERSVRGCRRRDAEGRRGVPRPARLRHSRADALRRSRRRSAVGCPGASAATSSISFPTRSPRRTRTTRTRTRRCCSATCPPEPAARRSTPA